MKSIINTANATNIANESKLRAQLTEQLETADYCIFADCNPEYTPDPFADLNKAEFIQEDVNYVMNSLKDMLRQKKTEAMLKLEVGRHFMLNADPKTGLCGYTSWGN